MELNEADFSPLSDVAKLKVVNLIEKLMNSTEECEKNKLTIEDLTEQLEKKNNHIAQQQQMAS